MGSDDIPEAIKFHEIISACTKENESLREKLRVAVDLIKEIKPHILHRSLDADDINYISNLFDSTLEKIGEVE